MLAPSFICTYYWWIYFRQFEYFKLYWQAFCGLENVTCALEKKVSFRAAEQMSCAPVLSCAPMLAPVHLHWLPCTCPGSHAPALAPHGSWHRKYPLLSLLKPVLVIAQSDILKHPILTLYTLFFQSVNFASDIWRFCYYGHKSYFSLKEIRRVSFDYTKFDYGQWPVGFIHRWNVMFMSIIKNWNTKDAILNVWDPVLLGDKLERDMNWLKHLRKRIIVIL